MNAATVARVLGGRKAGGGWTAHCPAHDDRTPSLSIRDGDDAKVLVHCHAGCDQKSVIAELLARGLWNGRSRLDVRASHSERAQEASRSRTIIAVPNDDRAGREVLALRLWDEAEDPRGTLVADYLKSTRGLILPDDLAGEVIRFHPALFFDGAHVAGMVALFRDIRANEPCGIHRTFLDNGGRKLGRRMLGRAKAAAIKLDADESVTLGLHIGEGVETALAARLAGFRPVWALGSSGGIGAFPVLSGIDSITILGEVDDNGTNHRDARDCAGRWHRAGREVFVVDPLVGGDLNDVWREVER